MRQLLTYPYGCAEQTASSTLPWVILRQSPELLPLVEKSAAEANAALEAGVERLLKMQTRSGGLAYWPGGSEPTLWASTYGAVVLGLARGTGAVVPENQWNELLTYLSGELRKSGSSAQDQCLALYALALGQEPSRRITRSSLRSGPNSPPPAGQRWPWQLRLRAETSG